MIILHHYISFQLDYFTYFEGALQTFQRVIG